MKRIRNNARTPYMEKFWPTVLQKIYFNVKQTTAKCLSLTYTLQSQTCNKILLASMTTLTGT